MILTFLTGLKNSVYAHIGTNIVPSYYLSICMSVSLSVHS